ncbi:hypothetical protein FFH90_025315 [Pseudomonas sp. ATCC 43928]|nr:hypothetical protein FFH90_025315 [Pseudomonas sp. ATCC 43928]
MLGFLNAAPILACSGVGRQVVVSRHEAFRGLGGRCDWCMMQGKAQIEKTHAGRATAPGKQSHTAYAGNRSTFPRSRGIGAHHAQ